MEIDVEKEAREIEEELAMEDARGVKPKDYSRLRVLVSVLLVLVFLSYLVMDPNVQAVITGFFESSTLEDDSFAHGSVTVTFERETYQELLYLWENNQKAEFKACLGGTIDGKVYSVNEVLLPDTYLRTVFRVVSDPCPTGTIIDLHSHPYQKCVASETDMKHLESQKRTNTGLLMAVMCDKDRISFYS